MAQRLTVSSQNPLIQVLVIEDDARFCDALCHAIDMAPDLRVAGRATTRMEGMAMLEGPPADVLLVDLGLPDGSGIDVIAEAARRWPSCGIMVSTHFGDEAHVMRSIEAGAAGYLLKDSSPDKIADEIRSLASGGSPITPIIARKILTRFRDSSPLPVAHVVDPSQDTPTLLSARETEVLTFITKGFTTQEISQLMSLSQFTVRSFVRRIYSKLKVRSKAEAIYEARNQGLLRD
jgi:DNA-binding NarL/FixJ family response regulator